MGRVNSELKVLKNQINIDWWVTKQPEKISSWAIVFRYKNFSWNYEIVTRKEKGIYKVRVKKWVKLSNWDHWWQTQKINNNAINKISPPQEKAKCNIICDIDNLSISIK
jgi:hypothetical protein